MTNPELELYDAHLAATIYRQDGLPQCAAATIAVAKHNAFLMGCSWDEIDEMSLRVIKDVKDITTSDFKELLNDR